MITLPITPTEMKRAETFVLIDIENDYHSCTLPYSVVVDGITYSNSLDIVDIDANKASTIVDREQFKVSIFDTDFTIRNTFRNNFYGKNIKVKTGFILDGTVVSTSFIGYSGFIDNLSHTVDTTDENLIAVLTCTGPMNDLDSTNVLYSSRASFRERHPTDTSMDEVYVGTVSTAIRWGKIPSTTSNSNLNFAGQYNPSLSFRYEG